MSHKISSDLTGTSSVGYVQLSIFIPKPKPISVKISLISFNDLRPKFLVLSISASERTTNSPINRIFAFFKQLAERTLNSRSSTDRNKFSFNEDDPIDLISSEGSRDSSKVKKI